MIGRELFIQLKDNKNIDIKCVDLRYGNDLRNFKECLKLTKGIDEVYSLVGIKGNPKMTNEKPVDFMGPMLQFDTNMIIASQMNGVKKFLYTSSIAVENPETDKYPAWAKRTAEVLIEAMRIQYPNGTKYCIVRPCNIYGKFDDLGKENLMVISDLIRKGIKDDEIHAWGDGSSIRDFLNAKDCARGMIEVMNEMPDFPINLCSGKGITIKQIGEIIANKLNKPLIFEGENKGADKRVMNLNWHFKPIIDIKDGIEEVCEWKQKYWKGH